MKHTTDNPQQERICRSASSVCSKPLEGFPCFETSLLTKSPCLRTRIMRLSISGLLLACICVTFVIGEDRLQQFYDRIQKSDVKFCSDRTKLLPECKVCIPGTQAAPASSNGHCSAFIPSSADIRAEIKKLTEERYPNSPANRPFGLYPYLETADFMVRQILFGQMLSAGKHKHVIDIGAYYNPIHLFLNSSYCPESVVVIEPILDPLSVMVPCSPPHSNAFTHVVFLPITFRHYMTITPSKLLPPPNGVVCIGCDSHYGPNRRMLETAFIKPYSLYLEYPSEYVHNAPFRKMMGTGEGESMTFIKKFQPDTNLTQYTKRVMKVINYV